MLIAVLEDGEVLLLADLAAARREIEVYEAESGDAACYDGDGRPLVPRFPSRAERRLLGIRLDSGPSSYELVPAAAETDQPPLRAVLARATELRPNPWFATLGDLRAHFGLAAG
jgi:hypothetical protein